MCIYIQIQSDKDGQSTERFKICGCKEPGKICKTGKNMGKFFCFCNTSERPVKAEKKL